MADTVSRNAQRRKAEADRAARAARERGPAAAAAGRGRGEGPLDGHPLRGRLPKGWSFDDAAEAAFTERRLNSQVRVCVKGVLIEEEVGARNGRKNRNDFIVDNPVVVCCFFLCLHDGSSLLLIRCLPRKAARSPLLPALFFFVLPQPLSAVCFFPPTD